MYPELLTRNDLDIFLPPIGGLTVRPDPPIFCLCPFNSIYIVSVLLVNQIYIFGDPAAITDPTKKLAVRNLG